MGRLVRDQLGAVEQLLLRGRLAQEDAAVVVERGAGMLHAAVLEVGQHDEIILGKRVGDAGIGFHIIERVEDEPENGGFLGQFRGIRFAVVHRYGPTVFRGHIALKTAGDKGEEIRAQRFGLCKGDAAPAVCG